jgi:hypothetical protein
VHLGCGLSHKPNYHNNVAQYNSCLVHNYIQHGLPSAVLRAEQTLVQTSLFTHRPISIISSDIMHETCLDEGGNNDNDNDNDNTHVVNEDLFLIFMLSNETRIPCACLVQIFSSNESKEDAKCTKLIQYYIRNVLNATHHTANPSKTLTFFSEVPMIHTDTF